MFNSKQTLTPAQYQDQFRTTGAPHALVDVRSAEEFAEGHIPNATNIALDALPQRLHELDADKEKPVILYCRSGRRSAMAVRFMTQLGYRSVYNLGGIIDWRKAGLPVE